MLRHGTGRSSGSRAAFPSPEGCERADGDVLLRELEALFETDPLIDEIGLVLSTGFEFTDEFCRDQPDFGRCAFILREHKLGVAFWCVIKVFEAATSKFGYNKKRLADLDEAGRQEGVEEVAAKLVQATRTLVLINADHYTSWNCRKRLMLRQLIPKEDENRLCNLVLSKHPKSLSTWAQKQFVLQSLKPSTRTGESCTSWNQLCDRELETCSRVVQRYPRCYSCWTYRRWICTQSESPTSRALAELRISAAWLRTHVSDHSAVHHRQVLLSTVISHICSDAKCKSTEAVPWWSPPTATEAQQSGSQSPRHFGLGAGCEECYEECYEAEEEGQGAEHGGATAPVVPGRSLLLLRDFAFASQLLVRYPGHESLWAHRRFLFHAFLRAHGSLLRQRNEKGGDKGGLPRQLLEECLRFSERCLQAGANMLVAAAGAEEATAAEAAAADSDRGGPVVAAALVLVPPAKTHWGWLVGSGCGSGSADAANVRPHALCVLPLPSTLLAEVAFVQAVLVKCAPYTSSDTTTAHLDQFEARQHRRQARLAIAYQAWIVREVESTLPVLM